MIVVVNKATKDTFSCLKILFSGLKIREKRVYGNDRKIQPLDLKKCLRYLHFRLLCYSGSTYQWPLLPIKKLTHLFNDKVLLSFSHFLCN